jgi:hypothetical protein
MCLFSTLYMYMTKPGSTTKTSFSHTEDDVGNTVPAISNLHSSIVISCRSGGSRVDRLTRISAFIYDPMVSFIPNMNMKHIDDIKYTEKYHSPTVGASSLSVIS